MRIPLSIALEMVLTGDSIDAGRAYELGLVNTVVAPEEVLPTAISYAERIAANGPLGVAAAKELVLLAMADPARAEERLRQLQVEVFTSQDDSKGALAFLEKRSPDWQGLESIGGVMSVPEPEEVVLRYLDRLRAHDWTAMADCLHPEVVRVGPFGDAYSPRGPYVEFLSYLLPSLVNYTMTVVRTVAGHSVVMVQLTETMELSIPGRHPRGADLRDRFDGPDHPHRDLHPTPRLNGLQPAARC